MEETDILINQEPVPVDKHYLVYMITHLLGVTTLLPWNFFITGEKYFQFKLRNTTLASNVSFITPLQHYFESSLAISATVSNVLCNILIVIIVKCVSMKTRFTTSMISIILLLVLTLSFVKVDTNSYQTVFFIIVILTIILFSGFSAVLNASACGLASIMPTKYMSALMGGQALGGTFASLANILALAVLPSITDSALLYFLIAVLVTVITLFGYLYMYKLDFSRYYLFKEDTSPNESDSESEVKIVNESSPNTTGPSSMSIIWKVFLKIWKWSLVILLNFSVTLSCFPAVSSSIQPIYDLGWFNRFYGPVTNFLVFNVTDLLGRIIAGKTHFIFKPRYSPWFLLFAVLRIIFIPLITLCNVQPRAYNVYFVNDYASGLIILFLGLTNGFVSNTSMMNAPLLVESHEAEQTGTLLSLFVTIGLAVGSCFSILILKLLL